MKDIRTAADGDVDFADGDLRLADADRATEQHKGDILLSAAGDFKETPTSGVGAAEYLNDENPGLFLRDVRKQMQADGMTVTRVAFDADGKLEITGGYENS